MDRDDRPDPPPDPPGGEATPRSDEAGLEEAPPTVRDSRTPSSSGRAPSGIRLRQRDILAGRFRVVRFIARGGMGSIYEAEDLELGERVAIKTLRPDIAQDDEVLARFRREINLARRVTHPNVCRIFDLFHHRVAGETEEDDDEIVFLVMELLDGQTLAERIRTKGPFSTKEAMPIVRQVASALDAAHRASIVHRDFKSANIILVPSGDGADAPRAVITDFGIARSLSVEGSEQSELTAAGGVLGTPAYVAPEQLTGGTITPAVDVYSFGVVLYEMVTGARPFSGDSPFAMAAKRLREAPVPPKTRVKDLDPRWNDAILKCLEREPTKRFASAGDIAAALEGSGAIPTTGLRSARHRQAAAAA
ncbi:MAG TPA: serine/threonine-protein kinase, partial [Thermoanaerobaculia bacterium]|nr:serine/threonine-protein kinase [Thermoanaerobaculia bacterium]